MQFFMFMKSPNKYRDGELDWLADHVLHHESPFLTGQAR